MLPNSQNSWIHLSKFTLDILKVTLNFQSLCFWMFYSNTLLNIKGLKVIELLSNRRRWLLTKEPRNSVNLSTNLKKKDKIENNWLRDFSEPRLIRFLHFLVPIYQSMTCDIRPQLAEVGCTCRTHFGSHLRYACGVR